MMEFESLRLCATVSIARERLSIGSAPVAWWWCLHPVAAFGVLLLLGRHAYIHCIHMRVLMTADLLIQEHSERALFLALEAERTVTVRSLLKDTLLNIVTRASSDGEPWITMLCSLIAGNVVWRSGEAVAVGADGCTGGLDSGAGTGLIDGADSSDEGDEPHSEERAGEDSLAGAMTGVGPVWGSSPPGPTLSRGSSWPARRQPLVRSRVPSLSRALRCHVRCEM
jgi:hypothetical protein